MKRGWSRSWKKSRQPRKQRKYRYNAPHHIKHKMVSTHLAPKLKKGYGRRAVPLRKGDEVKVVRGDFKGHIGLVEKINLKKMKVYVKGITLTKTDGSKVPHPVDASNLIITKLNMEDKLRKKALKR